MARHIENSRRFNRPVLLVVLGLVLGTPVYAQSNAADSNPPAGNAGGNAQDAKQTPAADSKAEPPASPEEMRQARIEEDGKKLFRLCAELRAEVAKTYKESLSLTVLKKAGEIEKLAKSLKALMDSDAAAPKHQR